jgi:hypothetical protein
MNNWLGGVGIPYLALVALAVIEGRGGWDTFARKFLELGIDMCVLGIGVTGALFANEAVQHHLGSATAPIAVAMLLIDLIVAGMSLHMRTAQVFIERTRATVSIFLGVLILAINTGIVVYYS